MATKQKEIYWANDNTEVEILSTKNDKLGKEYRLEISVDPFIVGPDKEYDFAMKLCDLIEEFQL